MKKIALLVFGFALLGCLVFALMARAQPPKAWRSLRVGDTIQDAVAKVPELRPNGKDGGMNQWYSAGCDVRRLGITYRWRMDVTFDEQGLLTHIDGRSYNDLAGPLDGTIRLPRD